MQELKIIDADTALIDGAEYKRVKGEEWPQEGDEYWKLGGSGDALDVYWDDDDSDKVALAIGNIFRTQAEVEECKRTGWYAKLVAQTKINRFCEAEGIENKFVAGVENYYPYYDHDSRVIEIDDWNYNQHSTIFHVRTESAANKIIAACGKEIEILLNVGGE